MHGQEEGCIQDFGGKPRRKMTLKPRHRWEESIKMGI
jgi:hypothetical protein